MYVEKMRDPGIKHCGAPTTGWKDPAGPWHWSAFVPVPSEPGMVYHVSGWSLSRWAACMEAMHTYSERYVPGLGWLRP